MQELLRRHLIFWTDKKIVIHLLISLFIFSISLIFNYLAMTLTKSYTGYVVPDILLDNLPTVNVAYIFFQGAFLFIIFLLGLGTYEPKYIPFVLESTAIFFFVRSVFMVMTHLTAPNVEYYNYVSREHHVPQVLFTVSSGNDLFFSAHTGFPFLLALIFWHNAKLRLFFILCSLTGAVAVILGHLHYSIDVFSAFFITFGVFEMSKKFFAREYAILLGE
jgi:hypothetical protein